MATIKQRMIDIYNGKIFLDALLDEITLVIDQIEYQNQTSSFYRIEIIEGIESKVIVDIGEVPLKQNKLLTVAEQLDTNNPFLIHFTLDRGQFGDK